LASPHFSFRQKVISQSANMAKKYIAKSIDVKNVGKIIKNVKKRKKNV
jgi:hypothetical protein